MQHWVYAGIHLYRHLPAIHAYTYSHRDSNCNFHSNIYTDPNRDRHADINPNCDRETNSDSEIPCDTEAARLIGSVCVASMNFAI